MSVNILIHERFPILPGFFGLQSQKPRLTTLDEASRLLRSIVDEASYPPHNIVLVDDETLEISFAVAGFEQEHLSIEVANDLLTIRGKIPKDKKPNGEFIYRGIGMRSFVRTVKLGPHVKVSEASLRHGLLTVTLKHEVPEEEKPVQVPIST